MNQQDTGSERGQIQAKRQVEKGEEDGNHADEDTDGQEQRLAERAQKTAEQERKLSAERLQASR